jgi:predicted peptidase
MRQCLPGLVAGVLIAGFSSVSSHGDVPGQQARRLDTTITKQVSLQYLLFLPQDYRQNESRKWPLMIFLHGAGERGTNIDLVTVHGPPKIVKEKPDFPFVVISPQCPPGQTWDIEALDALLDHALKEYAVDPERVYLTGLSMGGYGSWSWVTARPERFAAVVPICGGGDPIRIRLASGQRREHLAKLPVWAFHGGQDRVVAVRESERMIDAFHGLGNEAKLTIYPEAGHDSWTETYANPALYEWLLSHRRN